MRCQRSCSRRNDSVPIVAISRKAEKLIIRLKGLYEFETGQIHYKKQIVEMALEELYAHKSKKP